MKTTLLKLLKLRENEGKKVLLFFLFALFLQSGVSIGESVSSSLFLINVGFEQLPIIYILTPILMILVYFPIYSKFIKRYSEDKFFIVSLASLTVINVIIVFAIKFSKTYIPTSVYTLLFYFVMLYTVIWATALYTMFWNFIDSFFDILDSKRIFSIFSAGTAIGAIIGGSSVSLLTQFFQAVDLLLVWSFFAFLTLSMLIIINKNHKKIPVQEEHEEEDDGKDGLFQQLFDMLIIMKTSPYVLFLSSVFFISIILATTLEFEYMSILSKDKTEESLAALFGKIFAIVNIFNLIVNFFLFNRLVLHYGVRNMTLIQPIAYIIAFAALSVSRDTEVALLGFFVVQGILVSIDYNNQNLLYNGIRSSVKYKVRTFIENLGEPIAVAVAGLFLLFLSNQITPTDIAYIAGTLAFIYLIFVLFLRAEYPKSMVANLKSNWLDFSSESTTLLSNIDAQEVQELYQYSKDEKNKELSLDILSEYEPLDTLKELLPYLNSVSNEVYEQNKFLLKRLLTHGDPKIPRFVIEWIEENMAGLSLNLIRELGMHGFISSKKIAPMFTSSDPKRQATSAIVILNSPYPDDLSKANDIIHSLIHSTGIQYISEGIYALGKSKHSEYAFFISKFLQDKSPQIRFQALSAISSLSNPTLSRLIPEILRIFKDASAKERAISLKILQKIKDSQCVIPLLRQSEILTPYERRHIIKLIEELGLQTVPSIVTVLIEDKFSYSARSIAARTLGKLAFAQLKSLEEELILKEIEHAYLYLYKHYSINLSLQESSHKRLELICAFYKDIHKSVLEFILEILTIGGRLPDFEMIKTAINSNNAKSRANAIETIEQSTDNNIFALLLPLLDERSIKDRIDFYHAKFDVQKIDTGSILQEALASNNSLEQNIALEVVYHTNEDYKDIFRQTLAKNPAKDVKQALLLLLDNKDKKTKAYKLNLLTEHDFFKSFNLFELSMLLEDSSIIEVKASQELSNDNLKNVYIKVQEESQSLAQEVIGLENFLKKQSFQGHIFQEASLYLRLTHESILQSIHTYPTMGITFAQKMSRYETV